jgi:hypothetical protein
VNNYPSAASPTVLSRFVIGVEDDRVMTFREWCNLNGFSESTGKRLIASGNGPTFVRIAARRKGVTFAENRRWQASRLIETAA